MTAIGALLLVIVRTADRPAPALVLTAALAWRVVPAFVGGPPSSGPGDDQDAVKRGVLSLVLLDAAIAASFAGPVYRGGDPRDRPGRRLAGADIRGHVKTVAVNFQLPVANCRTVQLAVASD